MFVPTVEKIAPTKPLGPKECMRYVRTAAFDISLSDCHYLFSPAQAALVSQLCVWDLLLR